MNSVFEHGKGFNKYIDDVDDRQVFFKADSFIINYKFEKPFLLFIHTYLVHNYDPSEKYRTMFCDTTLNVTKNSVLKNLLINRDNTINHFKTYPEKAKWAREHYAATVREADDLLRNLFKTMEKLELLENTIIIITSDHGEEFWEHGSAEHGHSLYNELLHVPLIIAGPPISARRISEPVSLIDVMPTLLDLAGIPRGNIYPQAVSLVPGSGTPMPDRALYASGMLYGPEAYCLMLNKRKLVYRTSDQAGKWTLRGPRPPAGYQFFDLGRDPAEHNNLSAAGKVPADLDRLLEKYIRTVPLAVPAQSVHVSGDAMRRQLESLGYVQ